MVGLILLLIVNERRTRYLKWDRFNFTAHVLLVLTNVPLQPVPYSITAYQCC